MEKYLIVRLNKQAEVKDAYFKDFEDKDELTARMQAEFEGFCGRKANNIKQVVRALPKEEGIDLDDFDVTDVEDILACSNKIDGEEHFAIPVTGIDNYKENAGANDYIVVTGNFERYGLIEYDEVYMKSFPSETKAALAANPFTRDLRNPNLAEVADAVGVEIKSTRDILKTLKANPIDGAEMSFGYCFKCNSL